MNDPLSACDGCNPAQNGENAISARSDLNPANGTYPFGALGQRPHGGTDMKARNPLLFQKCHIKANKYMIILLDVYDIKDVFIGLTTSDPWRCLQVNSVSVLFRTLCRHPKIL